MATRKRPSRKRTRRRQGSRSRSRTGASSPARGIRSDLDALTERLDMMLPELIARVAAIEHLLVDKGICAHSDMLAARRFIDEQESR